MGIDLLDCCLRIETEFQLDHGTLEADKLDVPRNQKGVLLGATASDVARWVGTCMAAQGKEPPPDFWPRVQACIAATVCMPPEKVAPTSRIIEDLGFT